MSTEKILAIAQAVEDLNSELCRRLDELQANENITDHAATSLAGISEGLGSIQAALVKTASGQDDGMSTEKQSTEKLTNEERIERAAKWLGWEEDEYGWVMPSGRLVIGFQPDANLEEMAILEVEMKVRGLLYLYAKELTTRMSPIRDWHDEAALITASAEKRFQAFEAVAFSTAQ